MKDLLCILLSAAVIIAIKLLWDWYTRGDK